MVIVYTVGHSNRSLEELLRLLKRRGIELVIDVRRFPGSRKFPWFNRENLAHELSRIRVGYLWLGDKLGGFRRLGVDVEDTGGATCFTSPGFRAYALYVTTNPYAWEAVLRVEGLARSKRTALLCRERLPWHCHRKILSDILVLHGFTVYHIIDENRVIKHKPARCAKLLPDGRVIYT